MSKRVEPLPQAMDQRRVVSRRAVLVATAGAAVTASARADTLAEVPPRELGDPLNGRSERSKYVKLSRKLGAGPGARSVDPANAINSKTPIDKLVGDITPTDLHYERSHSGVPDLDPAKHRLLIHGMVKKPLVLSVDDLTAMPSASHIHFIECTGNGWENWKKADPTLTVQDTHGLVSTNSGRAFRSASLSISSVRTADRPGCLLKAATAQASTAASRSPTKS